MNISKYLLSLIVVSAMTSNLIEAESMIDKTKRKWNEKWHGLSEGQRTAVKATGGAVVGAAALAGTAALGHAAYKDYVNDPYQTSGRESLFFPEHVGTRAVETGLSGVRTVMDPIHRATGTGKYK